MLLWCLPSFSRSRLCQVVLFQVLTIALNRQIIRSTWSPKRIGENWTLLNTRGSFVKKVRNSRPHWRASHPSIRHLLFLRINLFKVAGTEFFNRQPLSCCGTFPFVFWVEFLFVICLVLFYDKRMLDSVKCFFLHWDVCGILFFILLL